MKTAVHILVLVGLLGAGCSGENESAPPSPGETPASADTARAPADTAAQSNDTTRLGPPTAAVDEWTAGIVEQQRPETGVAVLRAVRTGRHADFDRIVFAFQGDTLPGYHLEYIDRPVRQCGSGNAVELAGDGWLEVHLTPARAHTGAGEATVAERERTLDLPVLKELELTCDFEANVTWVLGVAAPNRYRVLTLSDPLRLVVDVRP